MAISYMSVNEAANLWGEDKVLIRRYCCNNMEEIGAKRDTRFPFGWLIPVDSRPPITVKRLRLFLVDYLKRENEQSCSMPDFLESNHGIVCTLVNSNFVTEVLDDKSNLLCLRILDRGWTLLFNTSKVGKDTFCLCESINIGLHIPGSNG